jgi:SulP family sulfate permease
MVTGAVGAGFTGSFIFSQTLFTGRAGVLSRLNGAGALQD